MSFLSQSFAHAQNFEGFRVLGRKYNRLRSALFGNVLKHSRDTRRSVLPSVGCMPHMRAIGICFEGLRKRCCIRHLITDIVTKNKKQKKKITVVGDKLSMFQPWLCEEKKKSWEYIYSSQYKYLACKLFTVRSKLLSLLKSIPRQFNFVLPLETLGQFCLIYYVTFLHVRFFNALCYSQRKFNFKKKTFTFSEWDIEFSYKMYQHHQS